MHRKTILLTLAGLLTSVCMSASATAASPVNGLTVNPALKNIAIKPGQTTVDFVAVLENDSEHPLTITPRATDFSAVDTNGAIDFKTVPDERHGLAQQITFSNPRFTLEPNKSYDLRVTISDTAALGPGGHFTALRYQTVPQGIISGGQIGMQSELVSFLFVSSAGQATYNVNAQWSLPHVIWGDIPRDTLVLFTNNGNTQSAPHGTITISGPPGAHRVAQGIINASSSLVLPGATRLLQTNLISQRPAFWPGWYTTDMYYRAYEGANDTHMRQRFLFVGWLFVVAISGLLLLIGVVIYWLRRRRTGPKQPSQPSSGTKPAHLKNEKYIKNSRRIPVKQL